MKYLNLLFVATLLFSIGSCTKDKDNNAIQFSVNGITDMKFPANQSGTLVLEVKHQSGNQETVSITINGLPANVSYELSSASGTPTYATTLTVTANNATPGTYPVSVVATAASGESRTFSFNLILENNYDCVGEMVGTYNGSQSCDYSGTNTTTIIFKKDSGNPESFTYKHYYGFDVKGQLDCVTNEITIPEQTFEPYQGTQFKYTGSGKFTPPGAITLSIKEVRYYNGNQVRIDNCSYTLVR